MLHSFAGVLRLLSTDSKSSSKVLNLSENPQNLSQKGLLCSYLRFFLYLNHVWMAETVPLLPKACHVFSIIILTINSKTVKIKMQKNILLTW